MKQAPSDATLKRMVASILPGALLHGWADMRCRFRFDTFCRTLHYRGVTPASALIVAPHPDDETFGCGGLISLKVASGAQVLVVLLTNGEAISGAFTETPEQITAARRAQFIAATEALGIAPTSLRFLGLPDGSIPFSGDSGFADATRALAAEIESFAPLEIYCPHPLETLPDHVAACELTRAALKNSGRHASLFYYTVWMWYLARSGSLRALSTSNGWRVDVSAVTLQKSMALDAYTLAPPSADGRPFIGELPLPLIEHARRPFETFFSA